MENKKEATFDSLNDDINSYSDALEILNNMGTLYKSYFNFQQNKLINRDDFIVDCGTHVIGKCSVKGLRIFHDILTSNTTEFNQIINIPDDEILYTIAEVQKTISQRLHLFSSSWYLEVRTFVEKNGPKLNDLNYHMVMASIDYSKSFIFDIMATTMERHHKKVTEKVKKEIAGFNRRLWILQRDIKSQFQNKRNLESREFNEGIFSVRDRFLEEVEGLKSSIEQLIVNELFIDSARYISTVMESEIQLQIHKYKKKLNKCFIEEMSLLKEKRSYDYNFNNKNVDKAELYGKCREVLCVEGENLRLMLRMIVEDFNIIMDEIKFNLESVFYNEFYSPIYDVKSEADFKAMMMAFQDKVSYFVYNLAMNMIEIFNKRYHSNIISKMKDRSERISKMYLFKPIGYMGTFNIYNPTVVIDLQRKLCDLYNAYNFEVDCDEEIGRKLGSQKTFKGKVQELIDKYIYYSKRSLVWENGSMEGSIEEKKKKFYENIYNLNKVFWEVLDSEFIYKFDYLNQSIRRDLEWLEREIEEYNK